MCGVYEEQFHVFTGGLRLVSSAVYLVIFQTFRRKNWNQLPAEAFGTFLCKPKTIERDDSNNKRGEGEIIEVWRKSSKCAVKWSEVKCSDVRWNWAIGNLNGVKSNERVVKFSWVKFKWEELKFSEV